MSATVKQMAAHIEHLCALHEITVVSHSTGGRAWRRKRKIAIRPIRSEVTYAIALHEIGHVLGRWQTRPRLWAEAGAWEWAQSNALIWGPRMRDQKFSCLDSYLKWAIRRQYRKKGRPCIPQSGDEFWGIYGVPYEAAI